jgi:hypothetical protein
LILIIRLCLILDVRRMFQAAEALSQIAIVFKPCYSAEVVNAV